MSGTVGIIVNDAARYTYFYTCLMSLKVPVNTDIYWSIGSDRIVGRNNIVKHCLEIGSEWVMFIDDDQAFDREILMKLLAHDEMVVSSLYMQRMVPFAPVVYSGFNEETKGYVPINLTELPKEGLIEVHAAGTGGMLIRSEVFRALEYPWFKHSYASEDLVFCEEAQKAGFKIHCDLGALLGHISPAVIWPSYIDEDEEWAVGFAIANNFNLYVKIEKEEK